MAIIDTNKAQIVFMIDFNDNRRLINIKAINAKYNSKSEYLERTVHAPANNDHRLPLV